MLKNLHVKNLALIREADIEFHPGLNILTGETGAGKSLLMGAVNLALGARISKNIIRHGAENAIAELEFTIERPDTKELIESLGYDTDDSIIISRKIGASKGIYRINGETAGASDVKLIASYLLDIHGQHEHQSLLDKNRQLEILDRFCGSAAKDELTKVKELYDEYSEARSGLKEYEMPEDERLREISLLEYELNEIDSLIPEEGEEEELDALYVKMKNSRDLGEYAGEAYGILSDSDGVSDRVGRVLSDIERALKYDPKLESIAQSVRDAESILSDASYELSTYLDEIDFSEEDMKKASDRLDEINHLKARYGKTISQINEYRNASQERLDFLNDYQIGKEKLEKKVKELYEKLITACGGLSDIRQRYARTLAERIETELSELNFQEPQFDIAFERKNTPAANGYDDICFMISANKGEPVQPLALVASGGEISRIMLAIKTILSDDDNVDVLVFDEIDSGISGRTAVKVAEKMKHISEKHQVICITHLAQIAAKADHHYLIKKAAEGDETVTDIRLLPEEESVNELARILGGEKITSAALENAREMKKS